jgi:hypothetical protein
MGLFVEYDLDGHRGQTKVWNECWGTRILETYRKGDEAPPLSRPGYPLDEETYSVKLGYGGEDDGWMNVFRGIITGWSATAEHPVRFSTFGDPL